MPSDFEMFPCVNGPVVPVPAIRLLCSLEGRGITVTASDGVITVRPRSAVTADDIAALRTWKPHVLAMLEYIDTLPSLPAWLQ